MPWVDFDDRELSILSALFDTLIPADDYSGGWSGGVSKYLEAALGTDLKPFVPHYKLLIETLGDNFVQQTPEAREKTLSSLDPQQISFAVNHAAEGYYASPGVGWEMIGYEVTA